ncbi:MAG: hypothetical protein EXQ56_04785 [Acidobacteria bacterium]|nr:hypothetical protein [Acidobacteriota bacterium]
MSPSFLWGQETVSADERYRALEERIRSLESVVASLKTALEASGAAATPASAATEIAAAQAVSQAPESTAPALGGAGGMAKVLNPDIGVIGNFIGAAGRNPLAPVPALSLHESEFAFKAVVDPYARADFFVAIGAEGAEIEEGYLTFTALPGGFLGKVGRMRSNFGKFNPLHNHLLPWVDRPLISTNLLGGDEGIVDEGLHISRILPAPAGLFLEGSAELYQGNSGELFQSSRRSDVSSIYRLRSYKDLSESTNLEVAGSYARGHNDQNNWWSCYFDGTDTFAPDGSGVSGGQPGADGVSVAFPPCILARGYLSRDFHTQLTGFDATLHWKPLRRAIYHSFIARAEAVWSRRQEELGTQRAFGFYASADYQLARRWFTGARVDWAERARDAAMHDSAQSLVLTYWPSEFSQIRGQLRRTRYGEGTTANEVLFQFQFNIGAHGAHPF